MSISGILQPVVTHFFEPDSNTYSYVVQDPSSSSCAIIDSTLDFEYASGSISHRGADEIIAFVREQDLSVEWIIETHVHADHLSAAPYLKAALGGAIAIGTHITTVQKTFGAIFNEGKEFCRDGTQFDHLFVDGEPYRVGNLMATAMHTPGHTPACFTHVIGDAVFVGDTIFMPDAGTARADFPGGDAGTLFDSIQKILALPDSYRVFLCHDYGPNGRALHNETTIRAERVHNIHVGEGHAKADFVAAREARDATLDMPRLIFPSLQVNMRAGDLPEPDTNGLVYLKVPINAFH